MSKSTPICDLQSNNEPDTSPIVADILKEIENEQNTNNQLLNNETDYIQEQQKSLEYQIDNQVVKDDNEMYEDKEMEISKNNNDNEDRIEEFENLSLDDDVTQTIPNIVEHEVTLDNNSNLTITNLFLKFKDPIVVFMVSTIIFIPQIENLITTLSESIPLLSNSLGIIIFKSLLMASLYYLLKNNI